MNTLELSNLEVEELSFNDLKKIEGGLPFIPVVQAIAIVGAAYVAGEKVGEFIYNITH